MIGFTNFRRRVTNLGKVLSSPSVSTVPTPDINSVTNLATKIDSSMGVSNFLSNLGLVPPTAHKPNAGYATGNPGNVAALTSSNNSFWWITGIGILIIVVFLIMRD